MLFILLQNGIQSMIVQQSLSYSIVEYHYSSCSGRFMIINSILKISKIYIILIFVY